MAKISEHASTVLNKIMIPVVTTILGATAIYFLGFNKKAGASEAEIEKSTVNAWQMFVSSENISYKASKSISKEYNEKITAEAPKGYKALVPIFQDMRDDLFRELDKLNSDIKDILKKNDNIDEGFISMLKRTLDNQLEEKKKTNEFVDNLISLAKSDIDEDEKSDKWVKETDRFIKMEQSVTDRQISEAEDISQALSKKYNRPFDLNDLMLYVDYKKEKNDKKTEDNVTDRRDDNNVSAPTDPNAGTEYKDNNERVNNEEVTPTVALLTGTWSMTGGYLELSKNGDMYWSFGTKGYTSGDWTIVNGKLNMDATNPDTKKTSILIGFLSNVTNNSFTLTFMTTPKEVYNFTRKN